MDLKKYHVNCDFVQVIPELIANTAIIFIDELGEKNVGLLALVVIMSGIKKKALQAIAQSRYFLYDASRYREISYAGRIFP